MTRLLWKVFSTILIFAMLLSIMTIPAFAARIRHDDGCKDTCFTENGITYAPITNKTNEVQVVNPSLHVKGSSDIQYDGISSYTGDITIPETVSNGGITYTVTKIANNAFYEYEQDVRYSQFRVTKVTLPSTITEIGNRAFDGCESLTTLNIPSGVTKIGYEAFAKCTSLKNLKIPAGVTSGLANVLVGYSTSRNLGSYTDSKNTTRATTYYPDAENVTFEQGSPYSIENGCLYNGTTLEAVVDFDVASLVVKDGTMKIADYAAWGVDSIKSISLPESLVEIGTSAFSGTHPATVIVPKGVTTIGNEAFSHMSDNTTLVMLSKTTPTVGQTPFYNSLATSINVLYPVSAKSSYTDSAYALSQYAGEDNAYGLTMLDSSVKVASDEPAENTSNSVSFTADVPTGCTLTVESADSSIATAEVNGETITVTSVAEGETTITAKITLDTPSYTLLETTATVTVIAADKEPAVVIPTAEAPRIEGNLNANQEPVKSVVEALDPTKENSSGITVTSREGNALVEAARDERLIANNEVSTSKGEEALKAAKIPEVENASVSIVIQPYLDVTILEVSQTTASDSDPSTSTLKLDITPRYRTVATYADLDKNEEIVLKSTDDSKSVNAVDMDKGGTLPVNGTTTVSIPLPNNFMSGTVYIKHTKENHTYVYTGTIENNVLSFENPHGFSIFEITTENPIVASIVKDDVTTNYASLQDAVDEVTDNGTITILKSDSATVSRTVSFTVTTGDNAETGAKANITSGPRTTMTGPDDSGKYTFVYSGGSSGGVTTYTVSTPSAVNNGTLSVSTKSAAKGATVTITVTPDQGYQLSSLTVTDAKGNQLTLTDKGDGKYTFVMPASKVSIDAAFTAIPTPVPPTCDGGKDCPAYHLTDVDPTQWYHEGVDYVVSHGMMVGVTPTTFAPNDTTTRGMIVTILYRLEGSPAVTAANPFTDVADNEWYGKAVIWAAENGVVTGDTPTTFSPNDPITREQMAAILYRYASLKGCDVTDRADLSGYTDAGQVSSYATQALQWANQAGLVTGTSPTTLSPTGNALRAQVATIFMRFCESVVK